MQAFTTSRYERISYGLSDTASNLLFQVFTTYLLFFYTDIYGLTPRQAGTLFIVARIADTLESFLIGYLIDHTHSKYGKSRPYFLWCALPFAIVSILTFVTPAVSTQLKIVWAYVTYLSLGLLYTAVNLPITSIMPSLTRNPQELTLLGIYRQFLGSSSQVIVAVITLPLVSWFGHGNQQRGFLLTISCFAVIAVLLLFNTFAAVRERVVINQPQPSWPKIWTMLKQNHPWQIFSLIIFLYWLATAIRSQTTIYYFQYDLNHADLVPIVNLFTMASLAAILTIPAFAKRFGKRQTMRFGIDLAIISQILLLWGTTIRDLPLIYGATLVNSLGTGMIIGLVSIMLTDTINFGDHVLGISAPGILASSSSFGVNFGMGIGGLITATTLSLSGYSANHHQSTVVQTVIQINYVWFPLVLYLLMWLLLSFYRLDD